MELTILCTPTFPKEESTEISRAAKNLGITRSELVRRAVRIYAAECVTTHKTPKKKTA